MSEAFLPVGSPVDLTNCEREPIHIPGSIQPHGVLLCALGPDDPVLQVSANVADVFGVGPEHLLGTPLLDLFEHACHDALSLAMSAPPGERTAVPVKALVRRRTSNGRGTPPTSNGRASAYSALVHQVGSVWLVELEAEEVALTVEDTLLGVRSAVTRLTSATSVSDLLEVAAVEIRRITGFDRVMVYRFDQDWNGQVVAEAKHDLLESFLGLHYPASDIPPQARALYKVNLLRFIRDIDAVNAPLVPVDSPLTGAPLDLSLAALRSVSPIHCEYLRNMGVTASMSVSIMVAGELAGLVACHHYSGPYVPSAPVRATCEFLAQTLSLTLSSREQDEVVRRSTQIQSTLAAVTRAGARAQEDLGTLMERYAPGLMSMVGAQGMAWTFDETTHTSGLVPDPADLVRLRRWVADHPSPEQVLQTDRLGLDVPSLSDLAGTASGVLALRIADGQDVLFLRPEAVQTVDWGGNPHLKVMQVDADGVSRLSPRGSFKLWRETVRRRSVAWESAELEAAHALSAHLVQLLYSRHRTVAMVAETLQRSLLPETLPAPPGWSFAADSRPASAGVGGDWYDAFLLPSGRYLLAVGDVAGHGLTAASAMAQLRNALRAYAVEDDDPVQVLLRLDRMASMLAPDDLATAVVATLDPVTGDVCAASAGHPSPIVSQGGRASLMEVASLPPLGAGLLAAAHDTVRGTDLSLKPGDALVLVSDGMYERRGEAVDVSLASLASLVDESLEEHPEVGASLRDLMVRAPGSSIDDDVTLLIVRRD
ncbi:SpoIIE family protein phosphatase [Nocardioides sp. HDW12B]|uniref:SpoIIE family protein phosphatase n=1 Tax=Nocardioides sp. HDW12B TaxID=2714939 RepID=UPI0014092357|nr:SpoIIE family protein phosphatase [Nocardioides sp. HDW12B]QIK65605.1 SpoIIE family protein phosphatase [Nocardioides sp. HDW12B]